MWEEEELYTFPSGSWPVDANHFQNEPTIENYLILRRIYRFEDFNIERYCGIMQLQALRPELEKHYIAVADVAACMDADKEAIDRVSLQVLELLAVRREKEANGENTLQSRGLAIKDSLINYLISITLEAMDKYNEPHAISSFYLLIREQLGGQNMALYQSYKKAQQKECVVVMFAAARSLGGTLSLRSVAKNLNIDVSAIQYWFEEGELERLVEKEASKSTEIRFEKSMLRALPRSVREEMDGDYE